MCSAAPGRLGCCPRTCSVSLFCRRVLILRILLPRARRQNTRSAWRGRVKLEALAAGIEEMQTAAQDRMQMQELLKAAAALEANEVRAWHCHAC